MPGELPYLNSNVVFFHVTFEDCGSETNIRHAEKCWNYNSAKQIVLKKIVILCLCKNFRSGSFKIKHQGNLCISSGHIS